MFKLLSEEIPYQACSDRLFDCLRDLPDAIWLDSGKPRSLQGRYDIISACPVSTIETKGKYSVIKTDGTSKKSDKNPFDIATQMLSELQPIEVKPNTPFTCGLAGYFGYD